MKKVFGFFVLVSIALVLISCGGGGGGGGGGAVAPAGTGTGTTTGTGSGTGTSSSTEVIASLWGRFIIDDYMYDTLFLREDGTAVFLDDCVTRLHGTYSFPSDELCTITVPSGTVNLSICDSGYIVIPSNGTLTASGFGHLAININDPDELSYYESIEHADNVDDLFNAIAPQAKNDIRNYCKCFGGVGGTTGYIGWVDYYGFILCNGCLQGTWCDNSKEDMLNEFVPGASEILHLDDCQAFKYIPEGDAAHGEGFYITFSRYPNDDQYSGSFHVGDYSVGGQFPIFAGIYNNGNLYLYTIDNSMISSNLVNNLSRDQFLELLNRFDANTYASLRSDILSISDYAARGYPRISFDHYADYGTSFNHSWSCYYNYIYGLME